MEPTPTTLFRRQIWAYPNPTTKTLPHTCSSFRLPSGGFVNLGNDNILTLTNDAVFQPDCPSHTVSQPANPFQSNLDLPNFSTLDRHEPFYSSTLPQVYAIAAVTIVSYMLVIMLFITPRAFYIGGAGGGVSIVGRPGTSGGSYGSSTVIGIGSRPCLQKLAALTLAISLTIVTADTFVWAERQYADGYQDADELSRKVMNGLEIRIVRLISESFLWLAQAQTLIRLFQRHKEKLIIKWTAFVLITLEIIFTILNHFVKNPHRHQPRAFADSIPALNYLFGLALNICYAAFVTIYALRKRRFAFYHPQMRSMPLMALLSLTAVLIPAIFFILDLSKPDVSGWGSYVRWVGACAASVVVWEWVERIEALEREEKKDGILGREVFDGDEMLESQPPKRSWPNLHGEEKNGGGGGGRGGDGGFRKSISTSMDSMTTNAKSIGKSKDPTPIPTQKIGGDREHPSATHIGDATTKHRTAVSYDRRATSSPAASSPIRGGDTAGAASTVYMVRDHPMAEPTPPIPDEASPEVQLQQQSASPQPETSISPNTDKSNIPVTTSHWSKVPLPFSLLRFTRHRHSPPPEVAAAMGQQAYSSAPNDTSSKSILGRLHLRGHQRPVDIPSGVIVVPAPPRRRPSFNNNLKVGDEQTTDPLPGEDAENEVDDEDRAPAAVRLALRMSNPASPVVEHGHAFRADNNAEQAPRQPSHLTVDIQQRQTGQVAEPEGQDNIRRTDHDR